VVRVEELTENFHHTPSQTFNRGKLPDVYAGQLLGKRRLVAGKQTPVREVIRKSLADEVMFLQGAEGMLKDGIVGNCLERREKFVEVIGLLSADAEQML
jgi:hypothetical protein